MKTHQIIITIGAGIVSLCAGTLLSSTHKDLGKSITLATLLSVPSVVGSYLVIERKATKRIREAQDKAKEADTKTKRFERQAEDSLTAIAVTQSKLAEIEGRNKQLVAELATLTQTLGATEADRARLAQMVATLQPTIVKLESDLAASKEQVTELRAELEAWDNAFHERVESEASAQFQQARAVEIERIFAEHDQVTSEAMQLFRRLQQWAVKISDSHESKRTLITSLAQSYNGNLDELSTAVNQERDEYLKQIEILNVKVGRFLPDVEFRGEGIQGTG